jgi:hypothetical protein
VIAAFNKHVVALLATISCTSLLLLVYNHSYCVSQLTDFTELPTMVGLKALDYTWTEQRTVRVDEILIMRPRRHSKVREHENVVAATYVLVGTERCVRQSTMAQQVGVAYLEL